MGNCRGNRYSRAHVKLSPDKKEFWDFSFHEIGVFDVPAMIDFILEETRYPKIHYIGHSQVGRRINLILFMVPASFNIHRAKDYEVYTFL